MGLRTVTIKTILVIIIFIAVFFALQRLVQPKYSTVSPEGNLIGEYYQSAKQHDIIFLGDCEVYANFSPLTLWEEYGITSFIRGSPQQLIWQSYYLLEDTLRYETPKIAVFNVLSMQYNTPQSEAYNRLTLDGMRSSAAKWQSVKASQTEDDSYISYLFPLLRYKERWKELTRDDFKYYLQNPRVSINGFIVRSDIKPVDFIPDPLLRADYTFGDTAYQYLDLLLSLTRQHNINLVLVKAPSLYPHWYDEWDEQIVSYASLNSIPYINLLNCADDIGLDYSADTFNAGLHLNVYGAEKVSRYFGNYLKELFDIPDRRDEPETAVIWDELLKLYNETLERQRKELSETGKISGFLIA